MQRKTAYKIALQALEEKQRQHYSFDHNMHLLFVKSGYQNEATLNAHKNYIRIEQAIEILEAEKDYRQLTLEVSDDNRISNVS